MKAPLSLLLLVLLGACTTDEPRQMRYANKQYYLGHDYFDKHVRALQKIGSLRQENDKLNREITTLALKPGKTSSVVFIRSTKLKIEKNQEIIKNEVELSRRFLDAALLELKKAVIAYPGHTRAHFELGLIYLKKASALLDIAKRAQCLKGGDLKEKEEDAKGLLALARKHFIAAARDKQLTSKAHNNISAIEIHFGNGDAAIEQARKSVSDLVYQDSYVANTNIGWAHFTQKRFSKAIPYFRQALLIQSKYCLARYRLGRTYFALGKHPQAEQELIRTVRQGPPCSSIQEAWLYLALSQIRLGKAKEAIFALSRCRLISSTSCVGEQCAHHLKVLTSAPDTGADHPTTDGAPHPKPSNDRR